MGGMYSGYIHIVGTEKGVGVRNQGGHIQADKTLTVKVMGSWSGNQQKHKKPLPKPTGYYLISQRQPYTSR